MMQNHCLDSVLGFIQKEKKRVLEESSMEVPFRILGDPLRFTRDQDLYEAGMGGVEVEENGMPYVTKCVEASQKRCSI